MNFKRILGFVVLIGAIVWFGNKFVTGIAGKIDLGLGFYFIGLVGLMMFLGIRQILRS